MSVTMFKYSETCTTRVLSENILKYLNVHKQKDDDIKICGLCSFYLFKICYIFCSKSLEIFLKEMI